MNGAAGSGWLLVCVFWALLLLDVGRVGSSGLAFAVIEDCSSVDEVFRLADPWVFVTTGRHRCDDDDEFTDWNGGPSAKAYPQRLGIGLNCHIRGSLRASYFDDKRHCHERLGDNQHNFDNDLMYFRIRSRFRMPAFIVKLYCDVMHQLRHEWRLSPLPRSFLVLSFDGLMRQVIEWTELMSHEEFPVTILDVVKEEEIVVGWPFSGMTLNETTIQLQLDFEEIFVFAQSIHQQFNSSRSQALVRAVEELNHIVIVLETLTIEYLTLPSKFEFTAEAVQAARHTHAYERDVNRANRDPCRIVDSSCAVVLRYIDVSPLSAVLTSDGHATRLFCGVFTTAAHHESHVAIQRDTWGHKCTAFLAFSTIDDAHVPSIDLPHLGEEKYANMWQKTRSIIRYLYIHFHSDFDWFLLGGDDMYVIVENLFDYLAEYGDSPLPKYLGRVLRVTGQLPSDSSVTVSYNSGGAGYLLNREALRFLANNVNHLLCDPFVQSSFEDMLLGHCLSLSGIPVTDTRDSFGRQRFHVFPLGMEYEYMSLPDELRKEHWFTQYDPFPIGEGLYCCSNKSVTVQYLTPQWMLAMDDYLHYCPSRVKSNGNPLSNMPHDEGFSQRGYSIEEV